MVHRVLSWIKMFLKLIFPHLCTILSVETHQNNDERHFYAKKMPFIRKTIGRHY